MTEQRKDFRPGAGVRNLWLASSVWLVSFVLMTVHVLRDPSRAIPYAEYVGAGARWLAHRPLYDLRHIDGFQYLPQSAIFFSLFTRLGSPFGNVAWRALGWACYALGTWRMARRLFPERTEEGFLVATVLALGPAISNLDNGQANLLLGALALHAAVALLDSRWWLATAVLAFGVALKPLMAVPLLLLGALYAPLRWRLPIALALVAGTRWLFRDHAYVVRQYSDCVVKLGLCATPARRFEDIRGLLGTLGVDLSLNAYFAIRAAAAVAVLAFCRRIRVTVTDPMGTLLVVSFGLAYLVLFNPRTLSSSYAMPGAGAALLGAHRWLQRDTRGVVIFAAISLAWTLNYHGVPFVQYWLRPLACLAFFVALVSGSSNLALWGARGASVLAASSTRSTPQRR